MIQGPSGTVEHDHAAPVGDDGSETEEPTECANCGGRLRARPCAWKTATAYRCDVCNAGGHITDDGTRHGPAFTAGWSV